jgi:hypothetical protein
MLTLVRARTILLWAACAAAGKAQQDPVELLTKIRHRVVDGISRLPRYMCTETVDRSSFRPNEPAGKHDRRSCPEPLDTAAKPRKLQLFSTDRLRLDVAIAGDSEMYSWVHEDQFGDRGLSDLVRQGATSTGEFSSYVRAIFGTTAASFSFKGESQWKGRKAFEFAFRVPLSRSGYSVSNKTLDRLTGYSGSFFADAETLDLLKLEIETDPLPPELGMCQVATVLDYTQVRMNHIDFLLPSEANMRIVEPDGSDSRNRSQFSGCHEFLGESKLIFDDRPAAEASVSAASAPPIGLAPGLKLDAILAQTVDPTSAAAGDLVTGKLTRPVKDPSSNLLIPKGTELKGRILELRYSYSGAVAVLEFGLKWESFAWNGVSQPLNLLVKFAVPGSAKLPMIRSRWPDIDATFRPESPGVGYFVFPEAPPKYKIPAGFETEWVTVSASPEMSAR